MIGFRRLDRYVLRSWISIFILTALGFPLVSVIINLTDSLERLLGRGLTGREILISYVYAVPEHMSQVMPAAVLFATTFTIGALARNSELTAAKASGLSFFRLSLPIFVAAAFASVLAVIVGEMAPGATARSSELQ
ncbi:MAG: LptF/LptG family permease, partial [Gemmatimonadota bacterium]